MRLFLALFFEQKSLINLWDKIALLKRKYPRLRFESLERLHLTLWFYGDHVTPGLEHSIINTLSQMTNLSSFSAQLTQPLFLPDPFKPHVFAYKAESPELMPLVEQVDFGMSEIALKRDRAFLPHITLARLPPHMRPLPDLNQLAFNLLASHAYELKVERLALVQSVLKPQGATYVDKWSHYL